LPVNGLKLEGAYSTLVGYYKKKPGFVTKNTDPYKRPIIFLKKTGLISMKGSNSAISPKAMILQLEKEPMK